MLGERKVKDLKEVREPPQRRAGTFTLGVVLLAAGTAMLVSTIWPDIDVRWVLSASPGILILLGAEVLLAARGGGRVKYDWLGMFLCFILVGAALSMYAAAWYFANGEYFNASNCSRYADETVYRMDYGYFDGYDSHALYLEAGDELVCLVNPQSGWLDVEIIGQEGKRLLERSLFSEAQCFEISESGIYSIVVYGDNARGGFSFEVLPADTDPPEEEGDPTSSDESQMPEERP